MKKIIIIGGGASGLMAAVTALKNGAEVIIIEKKDRIGTKILATGNGHCNFTNNLLNVGCYYDINSDFLSDAFRIFNNESAVDFFDSIGVPSREKNGYYYPYNMEASSILNAFRALIDSDKVHLFTETNITAIYKKNEYWVVRTDKESITGDAVIIACGTNASSKKDLNSTIAEIVIQAGHNVSKFRPALTYLKVKDECIKIAAGVRFPVNIKLLSGDKIFCSESGELQITSRGISGICVFQLSRFVSTNPHIKFICCIDFMPDYDCNEINNMVYSKLNLKNTMNIEELFNGILPKKLVLSIAKMVNLTINKPVSKQTDKLNQFILMIKECKIEIAGTGDISESQCLCGGVRVNEIDSKTMESKFNKGMYFAGEIIDVDGKCGGYNLQWAWTSGYIAGISASK